jgi:hypothetical protein
MPQGKGTYGNKVGRPKKYHGGGSVNPRGTGVAKKGFGKAILDYYSDDGGYWGGSNKTTSVGPKGYSRRTAKEKFMKKSKKK